MAAAYPSPGRPFGLVGLPDGACPHTGDSREECCPCPACSPSRSGGPGQLVGQGGHRGGEDAPESEIWPLAATVAVGEVHEVDAVGLVEGFGACPRSGPHNVVGEVPDGVVVGQERSLSRRSRPGTGRSRRAEGHVVTLVLQDDDEHVPDGGNPEAEVAEVVVVDRGPVVVEAAVCRRSTRRPARPPGPAHRPGPGPTGGDPPGEPRAGGRADTVGVGTGSRELSSRRGRRWCTGPYPCRGRQPVHSAWFAELPEASREDCCRL